MTSKERLNQILGKKVFGLLTAEGFKLKSAKSTFIRKENDTIQLIQFVASNNNHKGQIEKYSLSARIQTPEYPKWYLETYNTTQSIHHQTKINEKMIGAPNSKIGYKENWDTKGQSGFGYDLLGFEMEIVSDSILNNIENCILPYFEQLNSYCKIAKYALRPLDSFDYYIMSGEHEYAKSKLLEFINNIESSTSDLDALGEDFKIRQYENSIEMINMRIDLFFPKMDKVNSRN